MASSKLTASDPMAAALRLLTVRERSEAELAERLKKKGYSSSTITPVIERCRQLGYLNDERFALERCRNLIRTGRATGRRLTLELKKYRLSDDIIQAAVETVESEFDPMQQLAEIVQRRFPNFAYHKAEDRERRRVVNYFVRRGHPLPLVLSYLKEERKVDEADHDDR